MAMCTSTISKYSTLIDCVHYSVTYPTIERYPSLNKKNRTAKCMTIENTLMTLWTHHCRNVFTWRLRMLSRTYGFMLCSNLRIQLLSSSELRYPNSKKWLLMIRVRRYFYTTSDISNVSFGLIDCSLYSWSFAATNAYQKERNDKLACSPVEYNFFDILAKNFFPTARNTSFNEIFSTMLQFAGLLVH